MMKHLLGAAAAVCAISFGIAAFSPAQALTRSECSAKYQAAKTAGTLNGLKWNEFRSKECGADASTASTPAAEPVANPLKPAPAAAAAAPAAAAPAAAGNAVFPNAISPKYSTEKAGTQRMHTCLDQYNANKANNGNGGLKWIQRGGGYYSECNKRLKGAA
ncbi:hypothetical protein SAMN05444161_5141 [Rhizobiales bacterium GAS191]|jgi:hypothetical protein|nr:hypothetical protein SAMN05519103_04406 [Rhizobiales bacterium GAS113]SEE21170.1 hypothetical protein SAMN05444161_5141 [Rhizobiales bacterium GAS191]SEE34948.1 hypothetical protein SAMN05519104_5847 [Rhizobiales bacterium GAS188]